MKPKLLWLSDSPTTTTGYATITRKILNGLSDEFECHCLAHNYIGQRIVPPIKFTDGEDIKFHLHGAGRAKYSMDVITPLIRDIKADIFGGLLDTFMLFESGFMNVDLSPAKTFWYYPSDGGGGLPRYCEQILKKVEVPIAMSKFAKEQIQKAHEVGSLYIPHGIDSKTFYPLPIEKKLELRKTWNLLNKFVVGVVARNQGRKMLDRTLKAFKLFCQDKEDAMLLMHTDPNDNAQVFSLQILINRYKLHNRVIFTGASFFKPFTYTEMNNVYNMMDVFFLSTSGEGFGVPTIEAMACGVPQVCTNYTTTQELLIEGIQTGLAADLVGGEESTFQTNEIVEGTITGSWDVERGIMSINHAAECLTKLYKDFSLREKLSKNSLEKAKEYTWEKIIPIWKETFRSVIK